MKVLHCIAQLPYLTGSGVYFSQVAKAFKDKGYKNALLYAMQEPFKEELYEDFALYRVDFNTKEVPFNIVGMSDEMPYPSSIYSKMSEDMIKKFYERFKKELEKIKKEFEPDLIITHHIFILSSIVKEVFKDKKVYGICHGTDIRQVKKHENLFTSYLGEIRSLEHYFTLSKKDKNSLKEIFSIEEDKITVVGAGFKKEIFYEEEKTKKDKIQIVYAGKISEAKGVYELAKGILLLNKKYSNLEFIFLGNADDDKLEKLNLNSGYAKNLSIIATKNQEEMAKILRASDIFVLPSYYEGLGLVAVEALASSLRVVSTKIEGLIELLSDNINKSRIIEYVDLPRIYDVDKAYEEDKEDFVKRLCEKISIQIERCLSLEEVDVNIKEEIKKYSWDGVVSKIERTMLNSLELDNKPAI